MFIANLTKFGVIPSHLVLHMFKVCLDDFSGTNVENIALLLEGCGRYLLRSDETRERFGTMVRLLRYISVILLDLTLTQLELMRRKQSLQHFDQRQLLLLENAYYQVGIRPYRFLPTYLSYYSAILLNVRLGKRSNEATQSSLSDT